MSNANNFLARANLSGTSVSQYYYVLHLMHRFALSTRNAQVCQFIFFATVAVGKVIGGSIGDRIGRKKVI